MTIFDHPEFDDHETVVFARDRETGLRAVIAIHSTDLGPAVGGCRVWTYETEAEGLRDVLRLSRGMTFKNAAAGLPLGGGKAVIMLAPGQQKTPELMRAFGRAVDRLNGAYITAEDVGVSPEDMEEVRSQSRHVTGLTRGALASGDPSPVTARGVFESLQTGVRHVLGRDDLQGLRVAVQGLGHVGWQLCEHLHQAGAALIVTDLDTRRMTDAAERWGAAMAAPAHIHAQDCDVFAPCALGGILNRETLPQLRARLIVGAANNQLAEETLATDLHRMGIVLLPDFIVNAGGIMNAAAEIEGQRAEVFIEDKLSGLQRQLATILSRADQEGNPPFQIAMEIVRDRLRTSPQG